MTMLFSLLPVLALAFGATAQFNSTTKIGLFPFNVPKTVQIHGTKDSPPYVLSIPIHIEDFANSPIQPDTIILNFAGSRGDSFSCKAPSNTPAKVNLTLNCNVHINSQLKSQKVYLTDVEVGDTADNLLWVIDHLVENLNKPLQLHHVGKRFTTVPTFQLVQTGSIATQSPILESVTFTPHRYEIPSSGHTVVHMHVSFISPFSPVDWSTVGLSFGDLKRPYLLNSIDCYGPFTDKADTSATCPVRLNMYPGQVYMNGTYTLTSAWGANQAGNSWQSNSSATAAQLLHDLNKRLPKGKKLSKLPAVHLGIDHQLDYETPVLRSFKVTPEKLTGAKGKVTATFHITDNQSGIKKTSLFVQFGDGSGFAYATRDCKFPFPTAPRGPDIPTSDVAVETTTTDLLALRTRPHHVKPEKPILSLTVTCTVTIPRGFKSGRYNLTYIRVSDNSQNTLVTCCDGGECGCDILTVLNRKLPPNHKLPSLPSFVWTNTGSIDNEAPVLHWVHISPNPTYITGSSPYDYGFTNMVARFTDKTGVKVSSIILSFTEVGNSTDPYGIGPDCSIWEREDLLGSLTNVTVKCTAMSSEAGTWTMSGLSVADIVGNSIFWEMDSPQVMVKKLNGRLPKGEKKFQHVPTVKVVY